MSYALGLAAGTVGALASGISKVLSGANSARNIGTTTLSNLDSSIAGAVDRIAGISNANSAWNANQAREQRNWSMQQSQQAMQFNAHQAAEQRQWLEYMSNTAHQREVADLRAAGLNPVLSATGGNGAAVPSGASASASLPSGASAQADTSSNAAIVSLLGHFLQAQNNLQMADVSAKTNLAVADKYNAMSKLVAELGAQTERYRAELGLAGTKYSSDRAAFASQAAASINAAAARYGYDISDLINQRNLSQELYKLENYPNNIYQVLDNLANFLGNMDSDVSSVYPKGFAGSSAKAIESGLGYLLDRSAGGTYPIAKQWIDAMLGKSGSKTSKGRFAH